jgi:hypothetical protein
MIKHRFWIVILLFCITYYAKAQVGGEGAYSFLNLTITPRSAALGSKVVALDEPDPGVVLNNPAHLNSEHSNQLALSYVSYFADIQYGFATYTRHVDKVGTFGLGIQHVDYGDFIMADVTGEITGSFTGYDMALNLMYAYAIDSTFSVGINVKPVFSHLEQYRSYGICADIGVSYLSREGLFSAGVVARNIGTMIKPYTPDTWEDMPFELVAGLSQKLRHAPFRFVFTYQQLQTSNLYYLREKQSITYFGEEEPTSTRRSTFEKLGNELVSHLIFGVEFVPVKNFYLRGGYNFQRRNELKIEEVASAVGFSWGVGIKINKYHINYSRATYHLVGASNHFSVSTNLNDFFVRKNL